ncbi:hypothetical protein KAR28_00175 [Candidatus Parcubacteria bacterium]|nr:hypothetical protein [Candidatus Parcubacteria bacterium]
MYLNIKTKIFQFNKVICLIAVLAIFAFLPCVVLATDSGAKQALDGLNKSASIGYDGSKSDTGPGTVARDLPAAIGQIVGAILAFVGVLFLGLMIYGGFIWMMARGNESEVEKAKELIKSAVVGLVVILAAYAITSYVGDALTSVKSESPK